MLLKIDGKKFDVNYLGTISRGKTMVLYFPFDQNGPREREVTIDSEEEAHFVPTMTHGRSQGQALPVTLR